VAGLNWIINNRPDVNIVNMSLGTNALFAGDCDNASASAMSYASAINTLRVNGITVFVSSGNQSPVCDANGPYVAECAGSATNVALDSTGSSDPDGDPLSFVWTGPFSGGTANGSQPTVSFGSPGFFAVDLDVSDGLATSMCSASVTFDDTLSPVISCNSPATIIPPDAPITFTATAEDQCEGQTVPKITTYDCFKFTKKGKRIDKTDSCAVNIAGNNVTILDSGGVGDNIEWSVEVTDGSGNTTTEVCSLAVVNPGSGKLRLCL
jgi:hypothetical protein